MTKKHFIAIAELIKSRRTNAGGDRSTLGALYDMAWTFANYFASQNPRFNTERFIKAAGCESRYTV